MRAKGFSWGNVLAMVHRPPFVMEDLQDELNTSRVNASYTSLPAVLSPVSPSLLALDHHSLFAGFEWTSPYYSPAVRCMATPWTPPAALDLNAPLRPLPRPARLLSPPYGPHPRPQPRAETTPCRAAVPHPGAPRQVAAQWSGSGAFPVGAPDVESSLALASSTSHVL